MKQYKTAIVGCGAISDIYLKNCIERFCVLDVVCCCSARGESAKKQAQKYGIRAVSFDDVLNDPKIELAINLTPPTAHYMLVRALLTAGKHVYTEKVLSADFEQAKELRDIAKAKDLRLGVAPDTFLGSAVQTARLAIENGIIGEITSCHANVNRDMAALHPMFHFTTEPGGGIGFDLGIYYITPILNILGPVKRTAGMITNTKASRVYFNPRDERFGREYAIENENVVTASLEFKSGALGSLNINGDSIFPEFPGITFYGTKGILVLPDPNTFSGDVVLFKKGLSDGFVLPPTHGFADNSRGMGAAEMMWSLTADRPHRASADAAVHAVELLCGIVKSSETNKYYEMTTEFEKLPGLPEGYLDDYIQNDPEAALV